MPVKSARMGLKALMQCHSIPDHELAANIVEKLLEKRDGLTIIDLADELDVSYPLVLRVVNDLSSMGVIETSRVKPGGKGRSRKLARVNVDGLKELLSECKDLLGKVEELIEAEAK
ncbi:MAG: winged helix-turn-helix transcriptional regulator [Desulfurococcales archaeon]|nr:winged helix-turn-helix transcriptional regulator [Desulfurococcales archaeon]